MHSPHVSGLNVARETSKAFVLIEARIVLQYIKRFVQEDGGFYFNTSKPEILLHLQCVFPYCTHKQQEISDTVSFLYICTVCICLW